MLFQTPTFGLFLLVVVLGATLLDRRPRLHQSFLLLASWIFYMAWDWRFLGLILFSTVLDYSVGLALGRSTVPRLRRWLLGASLAGNLGVLGLFKYHDFFAETLNTLLARLGLGASLPLLDLLLPVGISFYTFQTLSYTIDIYRGDLEPRRSFVQFALFVAFFPQLVAGPIVRAREFLPQLDRRPRYTDERTASGIYLILKGLVKKVLFADVIGAFLVNPVWADPGGHTGLWVPLAFYGFLFQIYGDFAGYSDIAIGCGRLLGFELPTNFRSPFKARSFTEYWTRWHMTLGSWFRDYLFIPLGGSRAGLLRANVNVLLTFLLIGLWHGAAWHFVLWGGLHAFFLIVERTWRHFASSGEPDPRWTPFVVFVRFTLVAVVTGMVFRAPDLASMARLLESSRLPTVGLDAVPAGAWLALAAAVGTHFAPESWKAAGESTFSRSPALVQAGTVVAVLVLIRFARVALEPFYYFQF